MYTKGKVYLFFNNDQETHFLSFSGCLLMSKIDEKTPLRNTALTYHKLFEVQAQVAAKRWQNINTWRKKCIVRQSWEKGCLPNLKLTTCNITLMQWQQPLLSMEQVFHSSSIHHLPMQVNIVSQITLKTEIKREFRNLKRSDSVS